MGSFDARGLLDRARNRHRHSVGVGPHGDLLDALLRRQRRRLQPFLLLFRGERVRDVVAPLPKSSGLSYEAQAISPSTIIEIPPAVMKHLPDKTQLSIYKVTVASTSKINAYIRAVNSEIRTKNLRLSEYIAQQNDPRAASIRTEFVQSFLRNMPRMPAYATDLAAKLLDDRKTPQTLLDKLCPTK